MLISVLNYGVDVFLLLSGMSLYYSFSANSDYGTFIKKRCSRTLVPYMVIGLFYWIWRYIFAQFSILDFIYNASGMSLVLTKKDNFLALGEAEIWYVAFIMLMYAIYPLIYGLLFKVTRQKRRINFAIMLAVSFAAGIFVKFYAADTFSEAEVWLTRIPVFLTGCYIGDNAKANRRFSLADILLCFAVVPLKAILMIADINEHTVNRYLGIFAAFAICFAVAFVFELLNLHPVRKTLSFFGTKSFEIYIIHIFIRNIVVYYIPDLPETDAITFLQKILIYAGIIVSSVILSVIFSKLLKLTQNRLQKKGKKNDR